jgi:Na+/H+ antiporter NhaD/arsenite permease-like protein
MEALILLAFGFGYLAIALEHPLRIDKAASALATAVFIWVIYAFSGFASQAHIRDQLLHHLGEISEIIFFLLGAMTIVELIDSHGGFSVITRHINTTKKVSLLWLLSLTTFFMSALLDNLTTAIVMSTLLLKLIKDRNDLWKMGSMMIIAANAGGAWSPIGDVTTIMLWIGGNISAFPIMSGIIIPSLVSMLIPLLILSFTLKGELDFVDIDLHPPLYEPDAMEQRVVLFTGIGSLLFVPVFKNFTHLPPFMGILLGLSFLWVMTELMHRNKEEDHRSHITVTGVLKKVDTSSVLFFLGILLAVAGLQSVGMLDKLAELLNENFRNMYVVNLFIGALSAVVDNVPLVAGTMGMYSLQTYPMDHPFWHFLAYCAGTGGSLLIIGSAAGVATMGILKIDFIWYARRISLLALAGYAAGAAAYLFTHIQ